MKIIFARLFYCGVSWLIVLAPRGFAAERETEVAEASFMEIKSPAAPDSGEPNAIIGPDGTVYLTWCGPGDRPGERAVRLATTLPGAHAWSEPRTIVSSPALMENWADFPSLIVGSDGTLWAQWFQRPPAGGAHGYSGYFARSTDGGSTWTTPAALGFEFVSLAPLSGGRVLAVWLESTRVHGAPRQPSDPSMRLQSRLLDPQGATLREWTIDPDVCTCCQTTLTVLEGDRVFVAYRGHTAREIRDNCYAIFEGEGWTAPQLLHPDGWEIPGCPVNGPAAASRGQALAVAWFTAANGSPRVQAKYSPDGGATFDAAAVMDLGHPLGRIDTAMLDDGSAVVTWLETRVGEKSAGIYARRLFPNGSVSPAICLGSAAEARSSGFPRIAPLAGDQLLISWTEVGHPDQVRVREFAAPPPTTETPQEREAATSNSESPGAPPAPKQAAEHVHNH